MWYRVLTSFNGKIDFMMSKDKKKKIIPVQPEILSEEEQAVLEKIIGGSWGKYGRVAMAALSGLPWVGGLISAAATLSGEKAQGEVNKVMYIWVKEYEIKIKNLTSGLKEMFARFESFGESFEERLKSEEYLSLVRKTFSQWDHAETIEKKEMLKKLITNAGGITLVEDDIIRLFLNWIEKYDELHFKVIAEIYKHTEGITRYDIWFNIEGEIPRDDSPEGNLFKLLVHDLSTGEVIMQPKETDAHGRWLKPQRRSQPTKIDTYQSAFENTKPYVLTPLGAQFVHYVMTDLALGIEGESL